MRNFREFGLEEKIGFPLMYLAFPSFLTEGADATRYSVEINFRTTIDEAMEAFAKIVLGYVSAGIKQHNYHVKHVYTESPLRILVSSRNWDEGEWVCLVSWNQHDRCFYISKGFYNKERRTVSVQSTEKVDHKNAAEITKHVYNLMHDLKNKPDRFREKLKPVHLKRGPKS